MGAKGQDPKKWSTSSWWYTQYKANSSQRKKALYWREHADRVWDCNGMSEGLYQDFSGVDINTKARYNYSGWCTEKSTDMKKLPKEPGVAVFMYSKSSGYITHVGYLWKPVNPAKPSSDWWVIEARGVLFGVVATKLSQRSWNRWGKMHKYFDYGDNTVFPDAREEATEFGHRTLKKGCEGSDVKSLQEALIDLGFSCGRYGADGEFGSATKNAVLSFQETYGLEADGIVGSETFDKIKQLLVDDGDPMDDPVKKVVVTGGTVNIRDLPGTKGKIVKIAKKDEEYSATGEEENGWFEIYVDDEKCWISGKYAEVAE